MTPAPVLALTYRSTPGAAVNVFQFDGTASVSHAFADTAGDAFPTAAFTIAFWVQTSAATGPLAAYTAPQGQAPQVTLAAPGGLTVTFAGGARITTTLAVNDGAWHHIAASFTPIDQTLCAVTLYIDGAPRFETSGMTRPGGVWPVAQGSFTLGNVGAGTLTALASELEIWASALSPLQVATLYRRRAASGDAGLALVWALRDSATTGTVTGGGANPFVASTLTFQQPVPGDTDFTEASWSAVQGALSYTVQLWACDGSWHWSQNETTVPATPIAIPGVLLGRAYRGRICSVDASGAGPWSDWVSLTPIDLPALPVQFSWPAADQPLMAAWTTPDQAQGFLLDNLRDPPPSPVPPAQATTGTSENLTSNLAGDYGWIVDVRATAVGSQGPQASAGPVGAPAMTFYYVDDGTGTGGAGSFEFDWTGLPAGLTYLYFEVQKAGTVIVQQVVAAAGAVSPLGIQSPVAIADGEQITGIMRAVGLDAITHPVSRTVTNHDVGRPQLSWTSATSPTAEALSEAWTAITGVSGYNIKLYQDDGQTPVVDQRNVTVLAFDMTGRLAPLGGIGHAWRLTVQAVSSGEIGPSNLTVTPPVLASFIRYNWTGIAADPGVLRITWTSSQTQGLSSYVRLFLNGAATPVVYSAFPLTDTGYTVPVPDGGFVAGAVYAYQAYGQAEGTMAVPDAGQATIHRLPAPVVGFTANGAQVTLTASWPAIDPALPATLYQVLLNTQPQGAPQAGLTYDLTSALTQPAALTFQSQATLDNSYGPASTATLAPTATPQLRYQWATGGADSLTLSWTAAPFIYAQVSGPQAGTVAATLLDASGVTTLTVPKPVGGFVEGQSFTGSAKPIATGTLGATETSAAVIHQLAQPAVAMAQGGTAGSLTISWNDVLTPAQQGVVTALYQVALNGAAQGAPQGTLDFTFLTLLDAAGAQTATVQAQADNSFGILSAAPQGLTAPRGVSIVFDMDQATAVAGWSSVATAQAYYVRLLDASGAVLGRAWVAAPAQPPAAYSQSFPLVSPTAGVNYTVEVRALAGGGLSAFAAATAAWADVPSPYLAVPTDDAAADQVKAVWSFDPAASGLSNVVYVAELHQADGTLIPPAVSTGALQAVLPYPASTPDGTTLKVRVRATAANVLGPWSSYQSINVGSQLAKAQISSFSFDVNNQMRVAWSAVTSPQSGVATTYAVTVTGPGIKAGVFPQTVTGSTSLTLSAATTSVQQNQTYQAVVQATGPGTAGPASDPVSARTNTLAPPDPGGGGDPGGDPIAMATGTYSYSHADFHVIAAVPLELTVAYNSFTPLPGANNPSASDRPLGRRWNHAYNTKIYRPSPQTQPPQLALMWGTGEVNIYDFPNQLGPLTKQGLPNGDTLTYNADLTFTLLRKDQTRYDFDSSGRLARITSAVGNAVTCAYDGNGWLSRVTDAGSGRYMSFTYFTSGADVGRIQSVADGAGRSVSYAYTNGDLTRFTNASGDSRTFAYDANALMTQAIYENGDVIVANQYDAQSRVVYQQDGVSTGNGGALTIVWSTGTDPQGFATTIATMTDYAGNTIVYTSLTESQNTVEVSRHLSGGAVLRNRKTYDGIGNLIAETVYDGPDGGDPALGQTTAYAYDGNSNLIQTVYGAGLATQVMAYDARNNPVAVTDLIGNTTSIAYNTDNTVAQIVDAMGGKTTFTYQSGPVKGLVAIRNVYLPDGQGGVATTPQSTSYTYGADGQVATVTDPMGRRTSYSYDSSTGWRTGVTLADDQGHVLSNVIITPDSSTGRVMSSSEQLYDQPAAQAWVTAYTYDALGNVATVTDPLNRVTTYAYNANNFLDAVTYPQQSGQSERLDIAYTGDNLVSALTLSAANPHVAWGFDYDGAGRLVGRTDPGLATTAFSYGMTLTAPAGQAPAVTTMTTPPPQAGQAPYVQSQTSNALGRVVALTDMALQGGAAGVWQTAYAVGTQAGTGAKTMIATRTQPPAQAGGTGLTETVEYDAYGRVIRMVDAAGQTWTTAYSIATGGTPAVTRTVVTQTDPLGNQVVTLLDPAGRPARVQRGRPASGGAPAQWQIADYIFDALDNPVSVVETGPDGTVYPASTYTYAFDTVSSLMTVTCSAYGVASYVYGYDKAMQWVKEVAPGGVTTTYAYDSRGRLQSWTPATGGTIQYAFDPAGRFTTATWPDGTVVLQTLDACGNRLTTSVNGTAAITRTFDALNRMLTRTDAEGQTVAWTWTPNGSPASIAYPGLQTAVSYAYDGLQRLIGVTDWANRTTTYGYSSTGRILTVTHPNGMTVANSFDAADRFTGFQTTCGQQLIASGALILDAFGQPAGLNQILPMAPQPPASTAMIYDGDRLVSIDGQNVTYDAAGGLTSIPGVTASITYDALGQIIGVGSNTYGFDPDGGLVSAAIGGTSLRLTSDPGNYRAPRIEQADPTEAVVGAALTPLMSGPCAMLATLAPVSRQVPVAADFPRPPTLTPDQPDPFFTLPSPVPPAGLPPQFDNVLAVQRTEDGTDTTTRYLYGSGLLGREDTQGWLTYVFDTVGNTVALVDEAGSITDRLAYDPFGGLAGQSGPTQDLFRQHGSYGVMDFGDGLPAMRFRRYAPGVRRFVSRDIMFGDRFTPQTWNRYAYLTGNPLQLVDPLGLGGDNHDGGGGGGGHLSGGAIAGIIIGVATGVTLIGGVAAAYFYGPTMIGGVTAYNFFGGIGSRLGINFYARWGSQYRQIVQLGDIPMDELNLNPALAGTNLS